MVMFNNRRIQQEAIEQLDLTYNRLGAGSQFQDVADCLGFVLNSEERFKMESLSDVDQPDDDFWESATNGDVKHEATS